MMAMRADRLACVAWGRVEIDGLTYDIYEH